MPRGGHNTADLIGARFERLLVVSRAGSTAALKALWECKCDCGVTVTATTGDLRNKRIKSCGCYRDEITIQRSYRHGGSPRSGWERLYGIWADIRKRVGNERSQAFKYYGGKGVKLCTAWQDYKSFRRWALSNGYRDDLTIDRRNSGGDYCPENCEWVTQSENSRRRWHGAPARIQITLTLEGTPEELAPVLTLLMANRCPGETETAAA